MAMVRHDTLYGMCMVLVYSVTLKKSELVETIEMTMIFFIYENMILWNNMSLHCSSVHSVL
jgi:hypothetical protein